MNEKYLSFRDKKRVAFDGLADLQTRNTNKAPPPRPTPASKRPLPPPPVPIEPMNKRPRHSKAEERKPVGSLRVPGNAAQSHARPSPPPPMVDQSGEVSQQDNPIYCQVDDSKGGMKYVSARAYSAGLRNAMTGATTRVLAYLVLLRSTGRAFLLVDARDPQDVQPGGCLSRHAYFYACPQN